jgi:hypothetical protein
MPTDTLLPAIDVNWFTLLLTIVLPALTALVTKQLANPGLKAIVLLALSVIGSFITTWYQAAALGQPYDWVSGALTAGFIFLTGSLVHFGLLKPIGVTGADGAIARGTPKTGLGASEPGLDASGGASTS